MIEPVVEILEPEDCIVMEEPVIVELKDEYNIYIVKKVTISAN